MEGTNLIRKHRFRIKGQMDDVAEKGGFQVVVKSRPQEPYPCQNLE